MFLKKNFFGSAREMLQCGGLGRHEATKVTPGAPAQTPERSKIDEGRVLTGSIAAVSNLEQRENAGFCYLSTIQFVPHRNGLRNKSPS